MRVGDLRSFEDDKGSHKTPDGSPCGIRVFEVTAVGVEGMYGGYARCVCCSSELRIYEDGVVDS